MPRHVKDLCPSLSSQSSSSKDDISKSEEEIHISMGRPDDPMENQMWTRWKNKNQTPFREAFNRRNTLQAVISVVRRPMGCLAKTCQYRRKRGPNLHADKSEKNLVTSKFFLLAVEQLGMSMYRPLHFVLIRVFVNSLISIQVMGILAASSV